MAVERLAGLNTGWDRDTDVVVVGAGASGLVAAISAAESGARVVVLEKAGTWGGTSRRGEGGWWVPNNRHLREHGLGDTREDFLRFYARTSRPERYNPNDPCMGLAQWEFNLQAAFYDNASSVFEHLESLGAIRGFHVAEFPDYMAHLPEAVRKTGHVTVPALPSGDPATGEELIRLLKAACDERDVEVAVGHPVQSVIVDDSDTVVGVRLGESAGRRLIHARRGVIFASGGFTHNVELAAGLSMPVFGGGAVGTNEGDFVPIAQRLGAAMRNMSQAWMSPILLERAIRKDPTMKCAFLVVGDSVLLVNRYGRRALSEKMVYNERAHMMGTWDGTACEYSNLLMFPIWDHRCATRFGGNAWDDGTIPGPGGDDSHVVTGNTLDELTKALSNRLDQLAPFTGGLCLAADFAEQLRRTVNRYNAFARAGVDEDFHRGETPIEQFFHASTAAAAGLTDLQAGASPVFKAEDSPASAQSRPEMPNPTMYPLSDSGPYYAAIHAPGTLDTKGGPMTDPSGRVLREDGSPINGLYAVGNCAASASARGYLGAGMTIGPMVTFGWLAGEHAATRTIDRDLATAEG